MGQQAIVDELSALIGKLDPENPNDKAFAECLGGLIGAWRSNHSLGFLTKLRTTANARRVYTDKQLEPSLN